MVYIFYVEASQLWFWSLYVMTALYQSLTNLESKKYFHDITLVNKVWFHM